MLLIALGALGSIVAFARRLPSAWIVLGLTIGGAVQTLWIVLFVPTGVFWWYFVSLLPGGLLGISVLVDGGLALGIVRERRQVVVRTGLAMLVVALVAAIGISLGKKAPDGEYEAEAGWRVEAQRAGRWVGHHLPKRAVLSMVDSGAFGYYTPQEVMNLDGVISSYDYADAVCAGSLLGELETSKVRYLARHAVDPDYDTWAVVVSCLGGRSTTLHFGSDLEVYRSAPFSHGGREAVFVIWRVPDDLQHLRPS
jgi:hypothetical protein